MMRRGLRLSAPLVLLLLLAACAPTPLVLRPGTGAERAAQARRAQVLAQLPVWQASGRIGVADARQGGSGGFDWAEDGESIDFTLTAPITGRSFRLQSGPDGACLSGLKPQPVCAFDAAGLLRTELGWELPLRELRAWVLGMAAPGSASRMQYSLDGLPAQLQQDGWVIQYRSWDRQARPLAMPRLIEAQRAPYSVRLYVEHWRFPELAAKPATASGAHGDAPGRR
ncbi:lipoprotein insertase outer membrane protein LolB [Metallibacterium scheffleri]